MGGQRASYASPNPAGKRGATACLSASRPNSRCWDLALALAPRRTVSNPCSQGAEVLLPDAPPVCVWGGGAASIQAFLIAAPPPPFLAQGHAEGRCGIEHIAPSPVGGFMVCLESGSEGPVCGEEAEESPPNEPSCRWPTHGLPLPPDSALSPLLPLLPGASCQVGSKLPPVRVPPIPSSTPPFQTCPFLVDLQPLPNRHWIRCRPLWPACPASGCVLGSVHEARACPPLRPWALWQDRPFQPS